jgi:hypothetical protein
MEVFMETGRLWKEILFLLIPLVTLVALSLMVGCGRNPSGKGEKNSLSFKQSRKDPYRELSLSEEDKKILRAENTRAFLH